MSKVKRGAVVEWSSSREPYEHNRGVVLRLKPMNSFARAYGQQAVVQFYGSDGRVYKQEVGVGDLRVLGRVKRMPKIGMVHFDPHPEQVAHHEKIRDIRRHGQGASYDSNAPHNVFYERPLPGYEREMVLAVHKRRKK